jgi:hypothetical protein
MRKTPLLRPLLLLLAATAARLGAWDYEGHRMVNQLALAALPADFPAFVKEPANAERIAFLAGEPDRWRNVPDGVMKQSGGSWSDHFCDIEYIPAAGLDPAKVPSFRYDFILQFAAGRATHLENFPQIDPAKNTDTHGRVAGFRPVGHHRVLPAAEVGLLLPQGLRGARHARGDRQRPRQHRLYHGRDGPLCRRLRPAAPHHRPS